MQIQHSVYAYIPLLPFQPGHTVLSRVCYGLVERRAVLVFGGRTGKPATHSSDAHTAAAVAATQSAAAKKSAAKRVRKAQATELVEAAMGPAGGRHTAAQGDEQAAAGGLTLVRTFPGLAAGATVGHGAGGGGETRACNNSTTTTALSLSLSRRSNTHATHLPHTPVVPELYTYHRSIRRIFLHGAVLVVPHAR